MARSPIETWYASLLSEAAAAAKGKGFARRGWTFLLQSPATDNVGVLAFHRHTKNTRDDVEFTVELGIFSGLLADFENSKVTRPSLRVEQCQVRVRIGGLLGGPDKWWRVPSEQGESQTRLQEELISIIENIAIPWLVLHLNNYALVDFLRSADPHIMTESRRLFYLSVFEAAHNDTRIAKTLELLERALRKPEDGSVLYQNHYRRLVEKFPKHRTTA